LCNKEVQKIFNFIRKRKIFNFIRKIFNFFLFNFIRKIFNFKRKSSALIY